MPYHVGCCTNVIQDLCRQQCVLTDVLRSFLHYCFNQDGGSTEVSRYPGKRSGRRSPVEFGGTTWGFPEGGLAPDSGLASWVGKSLWGSPYPPEVWAI
jgi:hypothetical protein